MKISQRQSPVCRVALLHFSDVALTGGERMILRLVRGLAGGPVTPILLTQSPTPLTVGAAKCGVKTRFVKGSHRLSAREGRILEYSPWKILLTLFDLVIYNLRLIRVLRREQITVLWCSNIRSFLMAAVAARLLHIPIVWNIWAERRFGKATRTIYDLCLRAADIVVTEYVGQADGLFSPALLKTHKGRLRTVYTGVDDEYYAYTGPGYACPHHEPSTIVGCSRICAAKGLDDLISALDILKRRGRRVKLNLVGAALTASDEVFHDALLRRIDALQLTSEVEICGWHDDVKPFLANADLFVSASLSDRTWTEGLPGAVREAQAMGLPVVATDVGGTREAIADGETGILVKAGNPAALADAVQDLLGQPDVLKRMAAAAKRRSRRLFTIDAYVTGYSQVFKSLLQPPMRSHTDGQADTPGDRCEEELPTC